ncbi:hypothetical protein [Nocardioides sp. B-3]|uniref:hypothetical protein n=1 Tax=Nocardioides sp. B-3 TaxID=2895565 RepID=UPI0021530286|nr:hypothetical protein [Nocardioides sp. B-3]UUZ60383.1 hypothetical protein LP418_05610 [Nocardioides sp. B-3]
MCIDAPRADFDAEAAFWRSLLGWQQTGSPYAEFERLVRPADPGPAGPAPARRRRRAGPRAPRPRLLVA